MVSVGFANPPVGNTELPVTNTFGAMCIRLSASTTPRRGSLCIRVVPMWCQLPMIRSAHTASGSSGRYTVPAPLLASPLPMISRLSRMLRRSAGFTCQSSCAIGMPSRSCSGRIVTLLSRSGVCSPRPMIS